MTPMNIMILENNFPCFIKVKEVLEYRLDNIVVLPTSENWQNTVYEIENEKFGNLIKGDIIDLFIVDIRFKNGSLGIKFLKFLEDEKYNSNKYEFILMSNGDITDYNLSKYSVEEVKFLSKGVRSNKDIGEGIFKLIKTLYRI